MKKLTLLLFLVTQISFAQSTLVNETINKIEFKADTIKSVFDWVAYNIKYDVNKLSEIKKGAISKKNSNFKSEEEYKDHLLSKVIKQKKGVCEDYSLLFNSIVKELGYESFVIEGCTKNSKGRINRSIGHTWNAVKVDKEWKLYDPTWGAGYIEDEKKFVKYYNQKWFDVDPEEMIKTHMPYDPIWQLSPNPMNYENFENNISKEVFTDNYNYDELIEEHRKKEKKTQMQDQVNRSLEMGKGIRLIEKWRKRMTKNIGIYGITSQIDLIEEANENSNKAVELFNKYIASKNKQFKGKNKTIENARQYLVEAKEEVESSLGIYQSIEVENRSATNSKNKAIKHSEKLLNEINKELSFLDNLKMR